MKNKIIFSIFALCSALCLAKPIVAVDVGHHLQAPGAMSAYGQSEFVYNQAMAHSVAVQLKNDGMDVSLIGYNGNTLSLESRPAMAQGADLFVSIHHDSIPLEDLKEWSHGGKSYLYNDEVNGFGVFVSTKNPRFQESLHCATLVADRLRAAGFTPNYYHNNRTPGTRRELFYPNKPVYQYDNLVVLKKATMPAILIEAGVIINRKEAQWIGAEDVRKVFAQAVSTAIGQCLNH